MFKSTQVPQWKVILTVAFFLTLVANMAFFKHVIDIYPLSWSTLPFITSLAVLSLSVSVILLTLLSWGHATKPFLIIILLVSSFVAYFMDTYDVVIDTHMIENVLQTNLNESADLFSATLILYVVLIGVIPSILIYRVLFQDNGIKAVLIEKVKLLGVALGIALVV
ncbi:DUF1705 domain-containing protein, partial [Sulfuricurvum sp.]|uniref:DUF1705 domain-containing protein n=1 Tax=Sulfuricurvum sp. TaxID=2025608 RepID=UPI00262FAF80